MDGHENVVSAIQGIGDLARHHATMLKLVSDHCVLERDVDGRQWLYMYDERKDPDDPSRRVQALCVHWLSVLKGDSILMQFTESLRGEVPVCRNCGQQVGNVDFDYFAGHGKEPNESAVHIQNTEFAGSFISEWLATTRSSKSTRSFKRNQQYTDEFFLEKQQFGSVNGSFVVDIFARLYEKFMHDNEWQEAIHSSPDLKMFLISLHDNARNLPSIKQMEKLSNRCKYYDQFVALTRNLCNDAATMLQIRSVIKELYTLERPPKTIAILADAKDTRLKLGDMEEEQVTWALICAIKLWYLSSRWTAYFEKPDNSGTYHFPSDFNASFQQRMISSENIEHFNHFEQELIERNYTLQKIYSSFLDRFRVTGPKSVLCSSDIIHEPVWPLPDPRHVVQTPFLTQNIQTYFITPNMYCSYIHYDRSAVSAYLSQETKKYFNGRFNTESHLQQLCHRVNSLESKFRNYQGQSKMLQLRPNQTSKLKGDLVDSRSFDRVNDYSESLSNIVKQQYKRLTETHFSSITDGELFDCLTQDFIKKSFDAAILSSRSIYDELLDQLHRIRSEYDTDKALMAAPHNIEQFLHEFNEMFAPKKTCAWRITDSIEERSPCSAAQIMRNTKQLFLEFTIFCNRISAMNADKFCKAVSNISPKKKHPEALLFEQSFGMRKDRFDANFFDTALADTIDGYISICRHKSLSDSMAHIFATKNIIRYSLLCYFGCFSMPLDLLKFRHKDIIPARLNIQRAKMFFYFMLKKLGHHRTDRHFESVSHISFESVENRADISSLQSRTNFVSIVSFKDMQDTEWQTAMAKNEAARIKKQQGKDESSVASPSTHTYGEPVATKEEKSKHRDSCEQVWPPKETKHVFSANLKRKRQ